MTDLSAARVVIVGGGVIGLSIAYHLGVNGVRDVLLVERNTLTSGTTWHAAGIVGPLRATMNLTRLAKYAAELFVRLQQETGQETGYVQTGGYWLAQNDARLVELKRIRAMGDMNNLNTTLHSPAQIKQRCPWIDTHGLTGGLWVEQDARVNPVDLCAAYAKASRAAGVRILENNGVSAVEVNGARVKSITLDNGQRIRCACLVNACGAWARQFGEQANLQIPLAVCEHMYVVTEALEGLSSPGPIVRDLDAGIYFKEDGGKLLIGGFEANAKPWNPSSAGAGQPYLMFDEDWDHIEPMIDAAVRRVPALEQAGIVHFMNGPESFTPDTRPLLGKVAQLDNYFIAAGFNSIGVMSSAGVGRAMAHWIEHDFPDMDLWEVDVQRYSPLSAGTAFLKARLQESVHNQFAMHWPYKQNHSGRDLLRSPLHEAFASQGAVFGVSGDWERPFYFACGSGHAQIDYSFDKQSWWPHAYREAQALQHHVALIELSPFTKFDVRGDDAVRFLQWICANDVDVEIGRIVYTTCLNSRGGIEAEFTVTRVAVDAFLLVSGAATRCKDMARLKALGGDFDVEVVDQSEQLAVLGVMGPASRALLQSFTQADLSAKAFPFAHAKLIELDGIRIRVLRLSFAGELGYELYLENADAAIVFHRLLTRKQQFQMSFAGHYCLDSCRLEKGFLHWGHDIGPMINPYQAALDFSVKRNQPFLGQAALQAYQASGRGGQVLKFIVDTDSLPLLLHDEPIYCNNTIVGRTTSGGLGFRTGKPLCIGHIEDNNNSRQVLMKQHYELDVTGHRYKLVVVNRAVYDPNDKRLRG